jgi:hypothetical protein
MTDNSLTGSSTSVDVTPAVPPYRRFLRAGLGSGLLGGVCCIGSAIAIGAGLGGLSFFSTWMERYQLYFALAGLTVMTIWLTRQIRRYGAGRGISIVLRSMARQLVVMGVVFLVTLGIAMTLSQIFNPM